MANQNVWPDSPGPSENVAPRIKEERIKDERIKREAINKSGSKKHKKIYHFILSGIFKL
jgi:hypothetical protein